VPPVNPMQSHHVLADGHEFMELTNQMREQNAVADGGPVEANVSH
jgi:hypothetical protein